MGNNDKIGGISKSSKENKDHKIKESPINNISFNNLFEQIGKFKGINGSNNIIIKDGDIEKRIFTQIDLNEIRIQYNDDEIIFQRNGNNGIGWGLSNSNVYRYTTNFTLSEIETIISTNDSYWKEKIIPELKKELDISETNFSFIKKSEKLSKNIIIETSFPDGKKSEYILRMNQEGDTSKYSLILKISGEKEEILDLTEQEVQEILLNQILPRVKTLENNLIQYENENKRSKKEKIKDMSKYAIGDLKQDIGTKV